MNKTMSYWKTPCFLLLWCSSFLVFAQAKPGALSLDTILQSVNQSYPKIIAARLQVARAQGDYLSALGQFDPYLKADTRSQPEGGYINNYANNEFSIPTLANGIRLFAGYRIGRGDYPVYYQNYLTNSGGEYRAGVAMPLLRDFFIDKQRTALLSQAETIAMSVHDVAATRLSVYHETIKAYWQWVGAGLQLQTFRHLLHLAQKRQDAVVRLAAAGDLPALAVAENQQIIMQRQQLVNQGTMLYEQSAVALSLYYRDEKGQPLLPSVRQLPSAALAEKPHPMGNPGQTQRELIRHPAIQKLDRYYQIIRLKRNLAKNELLPNLDAVAYTSKQYGTGADPKLLPQAALVGVHFKFPVFRREAKGKIISTTSELRQIETERQLLYEQLNNQFSNLLIALGRYRQQWKLLSQELKLAQQVEAGEAKKFHEGDSTLFLVNQREQSTAQVQLNLINVSVNLQETRALVRFFATTR
ncbi:TolC family protein [Legionella sp. CNM-4043-24]|uniref:TolC family protein n=1 Tax=Legionella sp. CNM-4043-24 TaxID=3421646 RepID=UPI00403AD808